MYKQFFFLVNVIWIFVSELFLYFTNDVNDEFIDRLTNKLANLNVLYVKFFQAIALNNKFIDEGLNHKLLKFTDNAPWSDEDIDESLLFQLYIDYGIIFDIPIKSGMISLVFKAYKDDQPIIIKVKRRNIESKLNDAINNLLFFVDLISFIPIIKQFNVTGIIKKNVGLIMNQTDFNQEVDNMILMRENCKNLKYIKIPIVFEEVTKKYDNVIMMEYIDGLHIDKLEKEDFDGFAKQVVKFGFVTSLIHGVTHGDLHSGNILFMKDGYDEKNKYKLGIIDFGIINKLECEIKDAFFEILTELFTSPVETIAHKIIMSGIIEPLEIVKELPKIHIDNIALFIAQIIQDVKNDATQANQVQVYNFVDKLNSYLSNNTISEIGLKPCDSFVKIQLTMAMAHGITMTLCKDNYMAILDRVVSDLFHTDLLRD